MTKTLEETLAYRDASTNYTEYVKFRDANQKRDEAQRDFIDEQTYVPAYEYPALFRLYDVTEKGAKLADKKRRAYEAVLELEANRKSGVLPEEEYELYADYHEVQLKRILLTEAARRLNWTDDSAGRDTAREEFMHLNKELFGEVNKPLFDAMMHTESTFVENFAPNGPNALRLQSELLDYFRQHNFEGAEQALMPIEVLAKFHDIVTKRYGDALSMVPDTADTVFYEAADCERILNDCIAACSLGQLGAAFKITEGTAVPSTVGSKLLVKLPPDTRRNASQLKRLFVHEAEVHVRRAVNGKKTGVEVLAQGTANYADVEEGLGVILECAVAGNLKSESYDRARERYIFAGLGLGTDGTPKDGRATYEIMWRLLALHGADATGAVDGIVIANAKKKATVHEDNAFRGTNFAMPGVLYSKLKMYYEGLKKNADYFASDPDNIEELLDQAMVAKYDHTAPKEKALVKVITESHRPESENAHAS
jgi:hypothetical protein